MNGGEHFSLPEEGFWGRHQPPDVSQQMERWPMGKSARRREELLRSWATPVQERWALASSRRSTPSAEAAAMRGGEAPAVLPATWEAASHPEGTFMLAAVVDPLAGTTCGGLDIRSATMLRRPGTSIILLVNSAT